MSGDGDGDAEDGQVEWDVPQGVEDPVGDQVGVAGECDDAEDVPPVNDVGVGRAPQPHRWMPHAIPLGECP